MKSLSINFEHLLETAASAMQPRPSILPAASLFLLDQVHRSGALLNTNLRGPIVEQIRKVPDLKIFDGMLQYHGGGGASLVTYDVLADWLISRTSAVGAARALMELSRYIEGNQFDALQILALSGIQVDEHYELAKGIWLCPFEQVPDSLQKSSLNGLGLMPFMRSDFATAALTRTIREEKSHEPSISSEQGIRRFPIPPSIAPLLDASRILTISTSGAPQEIATWTEPDSSVPSPGTGGGMQYFETQGSWIRATVKLTRDDCESARNLYLAFSELTDHLKDRLRTPMVRLARAKGRRNLADAATDLGIALESIFLDQNENDEITFKLSTRAAKYLEDKLVDRRQSAKLIRALYGVRSMAVHTGVVGPKLPPKLSRGLPDEYRQTDALLQYGFAKVGETLARIIRRAAWPDWDSIVLA